MTMPVKSIFMEMALDHLMMINADSAMPEMQLHCHFARTFLELAVGEHHWRSVSPLTYVPPARADGIAAGSPPMP